MGHTISWYQSRGGGEGGILKQNFIQRGDFKTEFHTEGGPVIPFPPT